MRHEALFPRRPAPPRPRHKQLGWLATLLLLLVAACSAHEPTAAGGSGTGGSASAFANDSLSGGDMTVFDASSGAFGHAGPAVTGAELASHQVGDQIFDATFVPAPAPVDAGLGPRYDNVSCTGCHTSDGRGQPPVAGEQFPSILYRVSIPGTDPHGGPAPVPSYGTQLELGAIVGLTPEATVSVQYTDSTLSFADGTSITLHVPQYTINSPYLPLPAQVLSSPRVAPPNFGVGLLEAVPSSEIVALAQSATAMAAGVAGTVNYVWDSVGQVVTVGRFGLKANVPTVLDQVGNAFDNDMGVTSSYFPNEPCYDAIAGCEAHAPDVTDSVVQAVRTYIETLGVPARRNIHTAAVQRGAQLFASTGCAGCHVPTLTTGTVSGEPELSNQTINPYTDLLLHDMGPGLADGRPDFLATGTQWRTRPLWGIGLTEIVNGRVNFLHDGRAQSLLEAIMWHAGQAAAARDSVQQLSASDRNALVAFLNSL
jgi:CxxC motif-containing protein (DUF1111 family)